MKLQWHKVLGCMIAGVLLAILLSPKVHFDSPYSNIIYDADGQLLGGKIATDGQWRFPIIDSVPPAYEMALLTFEDKRFHDHHGLDFRSLIRAIKQNIKERRIVSGASTLTMQVCRMSRNKKSRSFLQKAIEILMAFKLEFFHSKREILALHASHAPYGGNVVGLEAASWRYYAKGPDNLSLGEAALLSVLPNAPSLMHPGKNRQALKEKRDRLLKRLFNLEKISAIDYELALLEDIPSKPKPLPRLAPHLLEFAFRNKATTYRINTTIDPTIQHIANHSAKFHTTLYQQADIQNLAILITDTQSGKILAYAGNSPNAKMEKDVDMIQARRSSGSVLKPFLHAAALDEGEISPTGFVLDVPMQYDGYRPLNYNKKFAGAVGADQALAKSLNVPAVDLLQKYQVSRFIRLLQKAGFTSINKSPDHYGLSLILGGAEVNLWELTGAYATMGRILYNYKNDQSRYRQSDLHSLILTKQPDHIESDEFGYDPELFSAAAIHHTFTAMKNLSRPSEEGDWQAFQSIREISWKTGTSFGHKDAWAVGVSPRYTVGIWVGNADGEGKHDLVGVKKAAPVLFDIFNKLEHPGYFEVPYDELQKMVVCKVSGYAAHKACSEVDTVYQIASAQSLICPYHIRVNVDKEGHQVNSLCTSPSEMEQISYLKLPANAAYYYAKDHPEYKALPAMRADCSLEENSDLMSFIYPRKQSQIFLPKDGNGQPKAAIFQVAHHNPRAKLYWHINDEYLGMTEGLHSMPISSEVGKHQIVLIDGAGHKLQRDFEIIGG